jgi:hypothetical protein
MAMSFELALVALKTGRKVSRSGWNGKGMWLQIFKIHTHTPIQDGMTMLPFIAMKTADNHFVPWLASQTDVLADDWDLVEG